MANAGHHDRWLSALFSVAGLLAAHIALGDAFPVEKKPRTSSNTWPVPVAFMSASAFADSCAIFFGKLKPICVISGVTSELLVTAALSQAIDIKPLC
ncbi:hypothetical protein B9Z48_09160 [Limnohabitans sp. WS1]|nr:hypothetical protein B9Z48_09160 [Limnohabitans sp. WS1]